MKKTLKLMTLFLLLGVLALGLYGCTFRPKQAAPAAPGGASVSAGTAAPEATATPEPVKVYHTVTYRLDGEILSTESVAEGETPAAVPTVAEDRGIVAWNADGRETDAWKTPVSADAVYDAVTGPKLHRTGGYMAAESDGLFHPFEKFTRSDAARAVYAFMAEKPTGETFLKDVTTRARCYQAATSLVTNGYMQLDNGKFYPDVAITKADFAALLGKLFSPGAVDAVLSDLGDPMTRQEAARVMNALLGIAAVEEPPYFPDVSPSMEYYDDVECAGIEGSIEWVEGERAEPGFVNLEGYLYNVGSDGYFIRDAMVGTLYFDKTGRYTSGNDELDGYVAEIIKDQTKRTMSRDDMLRTVYVYVRDHYLYLKRNIHEVGATGWEIDEALTMFRTSKGNCYNFTGAFWALARGVGFDAVCYSGLVGVGRDPHSWVEIDFDGTPYIFDVETEMTYRLENDYYTSMYKITYERGKLWSYAKVPYDDEPAQQG